jgi:hypothetical protein
MDLTCLIYVSRPLGYDPLELDDILQTARAHNGRVGITGALVSRWDLFLQLLEGPDEAVASIYERIRRDRRHVDVTLLGTARATGRLFADWQMRDDGAPSWLWPHEDVLAGRHLTMPFDEVMAIFARIAADRPGR